MAHRGTKTIKEFIWQRREYADGVTAGSMGWPALHSNCYYQKGYKRGIAQRNREAEKAPMYKVDGSKRTWYVWQWCKSQWNIIMGPFLTKRRAEDERRDLADAGNTTPTNEHTSI